MADQQSPVVAPQQPTQTPQQAAEKRFIEEAARRDAYADLTNNKFNIGKNTPLKDWVVLVGNPAEKKPKAPVAISSEIEIPDRLQNDTTIETGDEIGGYPNSPRRKVRLHVDGHGTISPLWTWERWISHKTDDYTQEKNRQEEFTIVYTQVVKGYVFGQGRRMLTLDFPEAHRVSDISLEDIKRMLDIAEQQGAAMRITGKALARLKMSPTSPHELQLQTEILRKEQELRMKVARSSFEYETKACNKFHNDELKKYTGELDTAIKGLETARAANDDDAVEKGMTTVKTAIDKVKHEINSLEEQTAQGKIPSFLDKLQKEVYDESKKNVAAAKKVVDDATNLMKKDGVNSLGQYVTTKSEDMKKQAKQTLQAFDEMKKGTDKLNDHLVLQTSPADVKAKAYVQELQERISKLDALKAKIEPGVSEDATKAILTEVQNAIRDVEQTRDKIKTEIDGGKLSKEALEFYADDKGSLQDLPIKVQEVSKKIEDTWPMPLPAASENLQKLADQKLATLEQSKNLVTSGDQLSQKAVDQLEELNRARPTPT